MARSPDPFSRTAAPLFALSLLAIMGDAFFAFPKAQPQAAMFPYLLLGIAAGASAGVRGKPALSKVEGGKTRPEQGRRGKSEKGIPPVPSSPRVGDETSREHRVGWVAYRGIAFRLFPYLLLVISLTAATLSWRRIGFDRHYLNSIYLGQVRRNWPAFLTEVQRALDHGAFRPHLLFFKGIGLQNLERYPEAAEAYRQALVYTPYAWFVHAGLGSLYLQQGRLQDALTHCQAALSICPTALDVRSNLAMIYQQKGDLPRARQEIQAVLQADPQDARALHYTGNLYAATNQLDSAGVFYERAFVIGLGVRY